jgi:hypothetical protein
VPALLAGGVKIPATNNKTQTTIAPPLTQGGAGGVKIPATNNKILYNNDKTLQQKLRKIQTTIASISNCK